MSKNNPIIVPLGALQTNCYLVPAGDGSCVVIDPGAEPQILISELMESGLTPLAVLLTHGHFDHAGAAAAIKAHYGVSIYMHEGDREMANDSEKSLSYFDPFTPFSPFEPDVFVSDGEELSFGELNLCVLYTPGHSAGSVVYVTEATIYAGDTIFCGSAGRTDTYSGDPAAQTKSLRRLKELEGDYKLYCGHGEPTELSYERRFNPYLAV